MKNKKYMGIIYIICSAFFFALMNMFVRMAGDLPSIQKSFFRNLVAFFFAFMIMNRKGIAFSCKKENRRTLILRSVFGTLGVLANFYAVDHLVLADASVLNKMSPFFAILFSYIILKEKITVRQGAVVVVAFLGSLLVIKPTFANMDLVPSIIGLCGGLFAGAAYTYVRKLTTNGEKGPMVVAFFSGFSCLVLLPFLIFDYHSMTFWQLMVLLMAGLSAAGGQFTITAAYSYAPAREISVYDYSQIIFAALLGFFVFGQIPDMLSWIGYAVIISMAVANYLGRKKE